MRKRLSFGRVLVFAATLWAGVFAAHAQVTITNADMFNEPGQYYLTYATDPAVSNVPVATVIGSTTVTNQAWNFANAAQEVQANGTISIVTNRYDYFAATNTPYGADFAAAGATAAQQLTPAGDTSALQWLYFAVSPSKGQLDYGFYDASYSSVQPETLFSPALQDWPASITYGSMWSGTTTSTESSNNYGGFGFSQQVTFVTTDTVDAFGIVTLPSVGLLSCLRVHEIEEQDTVLLVDGQLAGGQTNFVVNYYWLAPGHGLVAQVLSNPYSSTPPDDMGGIAATAEWMFQAYHPETVTNTNPPPPSIAGLTLSYTPGSPALIQWDFLSGVSSYTVNYATSLSGTPTWHSLGSTSSNFMMDNNAGGPGAPVRFYQIVATLGSK